MIYPTTRELEAGLADHGERIHAAWLTYDCPGGTPYALCQPAAVLNVIGWDPDQVNCTACIEVLTDANRAATAVMETGLPGGHESQHDTACHLSWCGVDPGGLDSGDLHRCHRLPNCHWPQQEVTA